jgi:hypothetical protein
MQSLQGHWATRKRRERVCKAKTYLNLLSLKWWKMRRDAEAEFEGRHTGMVVVQELQTEPSVQKDFNFEFLKTYPFTFQISTGNHRFII